MRSSQMLQRERKLLKLCEDPTHFAELILGHDLWSKQREILKSVAVIRERPVKPAMPAQKLSLPPRRSYVDH